MSDNNLCPKCGCDYSYCYCISNVYKRHTGAWSAPDWNLDPGHKRFTDEELQRIKDFFPKHRRS